MIDQFNLFLAPPTCAWLYTSDTDPYHHGRVWVRDGFKLGFQYSLDHDPLYIPNDDLSLINVAKGIVWRIEIRIQKLLYNMANILKRNNQIFQPIKNSLKFESLGNHTTNL